MPIVVVGLNHKSAPISLLERLSIVQEDLPKALHQLGTYEHVLEGVVLSTCNRTEVYAVVSKFHGGAQDLRNFLAEFCHVAPEEFADHLYTYHDDGAVRHLFRVASGIDSMVVGESEILGQVRRAFQIAQAEGMVQRVIAGAFRKAVRVGRRARTETQIGRNPVSVSSAAVELARRAFPNRSLSGCRVAVIGAGKMGRLAAQALVNSGTRDVVVVNRTEERAAELAAVFDATPRPFEELEAVLSEADIVISSTTAPATIVDAALVKRALAHRSKPDPLFVVDIAVPRDVAPEVAELSGVVLNDIDDLHEVVELNRGGRLQEVARVEDIVAAEVDAFVEWERSTEIGPAASALLEQAEAIRAAELARAGIDLESLSPEQRAAIDRLTRRIIGSLLNAPIDKARELASSKQGHLYLTAIREMFELDDEDS